MSQSTLIALAIVLLFLLYIAARGRLPRYMQVFGLAKGGEQQDGGGGGLGFSPTVPFGRDWWKNFLRPWQSNAPTTGG